MAGLISAFFWSLILLAMLIPWQQVLARNTIACGALWNLGEMAARRATWGGADADWNGALLFYTRFLGYPGAALLVWLVVHVKFTRACSRLHFPHAVALAGVTATTPVSDPESAPGDKLDAAVAKSLAHKALNAKPRAGTGQSAAQGSASSAAPASASSAAQGAKRSATQGAATGTSPSAADTSAPSAPLTERFLGAQANRKQNGEAKKP